MFTISSCKGVCCKCEHQEGGECSLSAHVAITLNQEGGKGVCCKCEHQEGRNYSVSACVAITLNQKGREYLVSVSTRFSGIIQYQLV